MGLTRKEQAARSRKKLLDAAQELITKKGYDAVSISDITKACGMSPGNFYTYFKSKEDIILVNEREPYDSFLNELGKNGEQPVINQLCDYIRYYVDVAINKFGVNYNRQWYVQHMRPMSDPGKPTKMEIAVNEVRGILELGVRKGEFSGDAPLEELAQYIVFELQGLNICHIMSDGTFDAAGWAEKYCEFVADTMLKQYLIS